MPLPHDIRQGSWVARFDNANYPPIGKVKRMYQFGDEGLLDVVMFDSYGQRLGRVSPAMGGPTSFEPACPAELWEPIEKPAFEEMASRTNYGRCLVRLRPATLAQLADRAMERDGIRLLLPSDRDQVLQNLHEMSALCQAAVTDGADLHRFLAGYFAALEDGSVATVTRVDIVVGRWCAEQPDFALHLRSLLADSTRQPERQRQRA